jgi:hypothetical protein
MSRAFRTSALFLLFAISCFVSTSSTFAQDFSRAVKALPAPSAPAVVTSKVDDSKLVSYKNSVPAEVKTADVQGRADASMVMEGQIVLHRTLEEQTAVDLLEQRLRTKGDPLYHQWLTPEELAEMFGPAKSDVEALETWMTSHGLTVVSYEPSQLVVLFTGTVADVEEAFHTQISNYKTADGSIHYSNSTNPKAPAALNELILSPLMLNNFTPIRMQNYAGQVVGTNHGPDLPSNDGGTEPKESSQAESVHPDAVSLSTFTLTDNPGTQNQGTSTTQTLVVTLRGSTSAGAITGTLTITNPTIGTIESVTNVATGCTEGTSTHSYTCTFTWNPSATLAGGTYTLTANYGGNTAYSAGTTTATFVVTGSTANTTTDTANPTLVDEGAPTTTVTSSTTWTGSGATPTGTVKLTCSTASAGTCGTLPAAVTVNSTNCTITTATKTFTCPISYALDSDDSAFGTYYMVMSYSGDGTYAPSASTANPAQVVDSFDSAVGVAVSPSPSSVVHGSGTSVTYTVTLTDTGGVGEAFTGTLSLSGTPITSSPASVNLSTCTQSFNGNTFEETAVCTITSVVPVATAVGSYTVTASYSGDANYAPTTGTGSVSVTGSTATSMTSSATPTLVFDGTVAQRTTTVTSITTWTGSGATPTGTVALTCGAGSAGTCTNLPAAKNVSTCTISTSAKTITCAFSYELNRYASADGTYNMTSTYSGDTTYTGASSSTPVINSGDNTVGITVSASPASVVQGAGTSVTYTVTLTDEDFVGEAFTGTLTFSGTPLTTSPVVVNLSTCSQTLSGGLDEVATCTITSAVPVATANGSYTLTAAYSGDGNYAPTTGTGTLTVTGATPTSTVVSANPTLVDPNVPNTTLTTVVTWTGSGATPTGTVALSCSAASASPCNPAPPTVNVNTCTVSTANKTITCSTSYDLYDDGFNPGNYYIVATYSGDATYAGSSSTVTVVESEGTDASTTTVVANPTSVNYGAGTSVTYTASVVGGAGEGRPSGSVAFSGTPITGSPLTGNITSATCTSTGTGGARVYTCPVSVSAVVPVATAAGSYTITASYGGNTTYLPSSGTTMLTVSTDATSTTVSATPTSITTAQTTVFTANVSDTTTPAAVPTGTVTFTLGSTSGTQVGSCTLASGTCSSAAVSGATLGVGSPKVYANYGGVTNEFGASSSGTPVTITVTSAGPANGYVTFTSVSHDFGQVAVGTAATSYG